MNYRFKEPLELEKKKNLKIPSSISLNPLLVYRWKKQAQRRKNYFSKVSQGIDAYNNLISTTQS